MNVKGDKSQAHKSTSEEGRAISRGGLFFIKKLSLLILAFLALQSVGKALAQRPLRRAPSIKGEVRFNTGTYPSLSMKALRGKVVLIFFWSTEDTYSQSIILQFNEWYEQYGEKGFEIIGVHSFVWDYNLSESELFKSIDTLGIKFPVVMEEGISLRKAYGQVARPSFFLIDKAGFIRAEYSGVPSYNAIETIIETLLEERYEEA